MRRTLLVGSLFSLLPACLPPPMSMPLEGSLRQPVSSTTAVAYGGAGVTEDLSEGFAGGGGGIRVVHQATENFAIGGETNTLLVEDNSPIFAGRIHGRYNPNTDALAFSLGVGAGFGEDDLKYATLDGGVRGSLYFAGDALETYLGGGVGASLLLEDLASEVSTLYLGGSLGAIYRPNERLQFGADVSLVVGDNELSDPFLTGGFTFNAAYHFGGKKAPKNRLAGLSGK